MEQAVISEIYFISPDVFNIKFYSKSETYTYQCNEFRKFYKMLNQQCPECWKKLINGNGFLPVKIRLGSDSILGMNINTDADFEYKEIISTILVMIS